MCESCAAPLLILIISMFYKKNEQGSRVSWFFVTVRLDLNAPEDASLTIQSFSSVRPQYSSSHNPSLLISSRLSKVSPKSSEAWSRTEFRSQAGAFSLPGRSSTSYLVHWLSSSESQCSYGFPTPLCMHDCSRVRSGLQRSNEFATTKGAPQIIAGRKIKSSRPSPMCEHG